MANMVPIPIKTSDYVKTFNVEVDGNVWKMRTIGAADEMAMSQAERRVKLLDKKIEEGTATDNDLNLYDDLEMRIIEIVSNIFNDGTEDNANVKNWVRSIPLGITLKIIEDIAGQVAKNDGRPEAPEQPSES